MAYQSEIEKLESRFREKPEQWFAALADAYRKAGDLDMALDVLNAWIGKRPNYTSGHIVLGRCQLDRGQDDAAAAAFENVLTLDMENVIALKSLSEIAERQGDMDGAQRWLRRLLEVDPMNEEARAALDQLGDEGVQPAVEYEEPPVVEVEDSASELVVERTPSFELEEPEPAMEGLGPMALDLERASEPPDATPGLEPATSEPEALEATVDAGGPDLVLADVEDDREFFADEPGRELEETPVIVPVSDLETVDELGESEDLSDQPEFEPAEFAAPDAEAATVQPIDGLTVDDEAFAAQGGGEERGEEADILAPEPIELVAPEPEDADVVPIDGLTVTGTPFADELSEAAAVVEAEADAEDAAPDVEFVQPPAVKPRPESRADAAPVTPSAKKDAEELPLILPEEVSADLEEPGIREPEPVVTETMAELYASQGLYAEARDIYRELLDQDPRDARLRERLEKLDEEAAGKPAADERSRVRRYAASSTGGVSVGSMLRELLGGPAAEPAPSAGLDQSESAPEATAPSSPGGADATTDKVDKGFSFDEFFGMPKSGTNEPRGSDDDDEEPEDGFRDWLKGLKK